MQEENNGLRFRVQDADRAHRDAIKAGLRDYNRKICDFWTDEKFKPVSMDAYAFADSGQLIGGITSDFVWHGLDIHRAWVHSDFRRQGVGSKLLKMLEISAVGNGIKCAQLCTYDFQAMDFYRKKGYREVGRMENWPGDNYYLIWMRKDFEQDL